MSKRHILIIPALVVLATVALSTGALSTDALTAETHDVELKGGQILTGVLRPAVDSVYLLQTDQTLYELNGAEIVRVDGEAGAPRIDATRKFAVSQSYRRLLPSGDMEIASTMTIRNRGKKIQTTVQWGAAPHEQQMYETMTALDVYGNRLDYRFEPRGNTGIQNVIVDLEVPVMPGEDMDLSIRLLERGSAVEQDGVWTYTHWGDYAEDRLQNLKVELPAGAEVMSVNPPVKVVEYDGRQFVFWRRYYPEGEQFPLSVSYRLD